MKRLLEYQRKEFGKKNKSKAGCCTLSAERCQWTAEYVHTTHDTRYTAAHYRSKCQSNSSSFWTPSAHSSQIVGRSVDDVKLQIFWALLWIHKVSIIFLFVVFFSVARIVVSFRLGAWPGSFWWMCIAKALAQDFRECSARRTFKFLMDSPTYSLPQIQRVQ